MSALGRVKVNCVLPSAACGTLAPPASTTATSADASGDQPIGRSPASDCAPTAVSITLLPLGIAPPGMAALTGFVTAVSPPLVSNIGEVPSEVFGSPRLVSRMSMGTMPAPAGTTTCRNTVVYPGADACTVCAPSGSGIVYRPRDSDVALTATCGETLGVVFGAAARAVPARARTESTELIRMVTGDPFSVGPARCR